MNDFYQGVIAAIGMLGGMCAFNYWMFGMMEKRLEVKIDSVVEDVHSLVQEVKQQRRDMDHLYKFVLQATQK